jgi:hypothetical protein
VKKESTVQQAITTNLQGAFVNRRSVQAQQELQQVLQLVRQTTLTDQDKRLSQFSRTADKLDTLTIYRLLKAKGQSNDPASTFIWKNAAPLRVQLFIWLLIRGRMQCRSNLYHKKIVDSSICTVCGAAEETPDHIIFHCPIALECWSAIGLPGNQNPQAQNLYCIQKLQNVPEYLMISSVRSSPFVAGKFGKEETSCIPK